MSYQHSEFILEKYGLDYDKLDIYFKDKINPTIYALALGYANASDDTKESVMLGLIKEAKENIEGVDDSVRVDIRKYAALINSTKD